MCCRSDRIVPYCLLYSSILWISDRKRICMMFWKKKKTNDNTILDKLIEIVQFVQMEVKVLQKDIELINAKLRKKVYKETAEEEPSTERVLYNDGFDELRKLNK